MKRTRKPLILTHDPSTTAWGWAVMYGDAIVACGCIKTEPKAKALRIRKGDDRCRRANEISEELKRIIEQYGVSYMISEQPHGSQNAQAAVMMGMCLGILQNISVFGNIGLEWYSEGDSKMSLLRKRSAAKGETIAAIDKLYTVEWAGKKYIDEAVADAISIHYCAKKESPFMKSF